MKFVFKTRPHAGTACLLGHTNRPAVIEKPEVEPQPNAKAIVTKVGFGRGRASAMLSFQAPPEHGLSIVFLKKAMCRHSLP